MIIPAGRRVTPARLLEFTVNRDDDRRCACICGPAIDSGELYHDGRSGAQRLLRRPLP